MSSGGANPAVSTQNTVPVRSVMVGDYGAADEGSFFTACLADGRRIITSGHQVHLRGESSGPSADRPTKVEV